MFEFLFSTPAVPYVPKYTNEDIDAILGIPAKATKTKSSKPKHVQKAIDNAMSSTPSNIKEFTLPDGSVVCINTDETEFEEETVIDSITK
jgi:hypothetical protein